MSFLKNPLNQYRKLLNNPLLWLGNKAFPSIYSSGNINGIDLKSIAETTGMAFQVSINNNLVIERKVFQKIRLIQIKLSLLSYLFVNSLNETIML